MMENNPSSNPADSDADIPENVNQSPESSDESSADEIQFIDNDTGDSTLSVVNEVGVNKPPVIIADDEGSETNDEIPLANEVHQIRDSERARKVAENHRFDPIIYAATGGAVGAIVLGLLSILGAFVSSASILTGIFGIALGVWGLNSKYKWWSVAGLLCSTVGFILSILLTQFELTIV